MPELERPDGARIHWETAGQGPCVVLTLQFFGFASVFSDLTKDLARDHQVVTYDLRGTGKSTCQGPYDMKTDVEDLAALIEEAGAPAVLMAIADGTNRAVRLAEARPELVVAVVSPGGNPVGREAVKGTDGLAASDSVVDALINMAETDFRGALRAMLSSGNPNLDEDGLKERVQSTVENIPHDVALERMRYWVDDNCGDEARAIGDRLWILESGTNQWFPIESLDRTRELLPEAHIEVVEDGAVSRPDITAGYIRRLTSEARPIGMGRARAHDPSSAKGSSNSPRR